MVSQQRINAALNDFLDATSFPAALERPCAVCACDCPSKDITDFDVPLDSVARADEGKADGKAAAPVRGPSDAPVAKWRAVLQQDAIQPPPAGYPGCGALSGVALEPAGCDVPRRKLSVCKRCLQALNKDKMPAWALANFFWKGPAVEFPAATLPEQMLVSLLRCVFILLFCWRAPQ